MDISHFRKDYTRSGLERSRLPACPFQFFEKWFEQARQAGINEPNAMSLATISKDLCPAVRTVLLKQFDKNGCVFFTNYNSDKAKDLDNHPKAALLFPWIELERQVRISGDVVKISEQESLTYFQSRPKGSQLGAWASPQSQIIKSRDELTNELAKITSKFDEKSVPLPDFWGGYRVIPNRFEFWQGRTSRLHDRFVYIKNQDENSKSSNLWTLQRLAP